MSSYLKNIKDSFRTLSGGLKLTLSNLLDARKSRTPIGVAEEGYFEADKGIFTLQYPNESFPVPDNGRYRLHNEIDDCIVCDKCAKVCPVDCIEIEPIKSAETIGNTSDGTPKRIYAAKFDIDMGKCCFCGLCTTVCPTECLTMTKVYDFSEFDVKDHTYAFGEMSLVEIAQKRNEALETERKKAEEKAKIAEEKSASISSKSNESIATQENTGTKPEAKSGRPVFRPKVPVTKNKTEEKREAKDPSIEKPKPVFRPKPLIKKKPDNKVETKKASPSKPIVKPKPIIKKKEDPQQSGEELKATDSDKPKPKFRPRPIVKRKPKDDDNAS